MPEIATFLSAGGAGVVSGVPEAGAFAGLRELFEERVVVLDGAMGSVIQEFKLGEGDFRGGAGGRFAGHGVDLRGNNELLCLTRPDVIEKIHAAYFAAGADMVTTNTLNATSISQADYGLEGVVTEMNVAAAAIARRAARRAEKGSTDNSRLSRNVSTYSKTSELMECGDLSPLLTSRLVGSQQRMHETLRGGVTSPAVKSGDKSPHSIATRLPRQSHPVCANPQNTNAFLNPKTGTDRIVCATFKPRRCFVAGSVGPLNRMLSMSPDVNRPEFRAVSWNQVVAAYTEQIRALAAPAEDTGGEPGVDALLIETVFDTLNCKAALFAAENVFLEMGVRLPVMVSVTITDASGRTLSGQTPEAFYNSVRHARPFSVGINCGLGGAGMRPFVEELARIAECPVTCYPNAGLPNAFGGYDETPAEMARVLRSFADAGLVNLVGGCCGSTPAHIRAIAEAVSKLAPRVVPPQRGELRLSGLEALNIG